MTDWTTIDIISPDLDPYRSGNRGIDYVHTLKATEPGRHVWINALMHGNEICGAIVLDALLRADFRPRRGTLTLSFANVAAYHNRDADNPLGTRFVDEDMNRVWHKLDDGAASTEVSRARALRPIAHEADQLIDIHAMYYPSEPVTIVGRTTDRVKLDQGLAYARDVGFPTLLIADVGHADGMRLRDYGAFGDPTKPNTALVVECGPLTKADSATVAFEIVKRALLAAELCDPQDVEFLLGSSAGASAEMRLVEVTDAIAPTTSAFQFVQHFRGDEVIGSKGTPIAVDGTRTITTPYDDCFLLFPTHAPVVGATAVRFGRFSRI